MDYSLTEDQTAIAELAEKIFREQVTDSVQADYQERCNEGLWQILADAGLTGLGLAEQHGGSGMGFIAQCLVVQAQGAVLAQVPLAETLLAAQSLQAGGVSEGLARVASGDAWLSLSLAEGLSLEGDTLQGELNLVPWAEGALYLVVRAGDRLLAFNPAASSVEFTPQRVSNGRPTSRVLVKSAQALNLGGAEAIANLQQRQQVMTAALQLGVAQEALKRTAAYTSERKQFGKPLAAFQAVSHRAADGYMDIEALRGVIDSAMWRLEEGLDATLQAGAARWWAAETSHRVSHTAQHLHGGIGADLMYPIHRYFLWAKQMEFDLGGASQQLAAMGRHLASNDQSGITL